VRGPAEKRPRWPAGGLRACCRRLRLRYRHRLVSAKKTSWCRVTQRRMVTNRRRTRQPVLPTLWPIVSGFVHSAWDVAFAAVAVVLVAAAGAVVLVEFVDGTNAAVAVVSRRHWPPVNKRLDLMAAETHNDTIIDQN